MVDGTMGRCRFVCGACLEGVPTEDEEAMCGCEKNAFFFSESCASA